MFYVSNLSIESRYLALMQLTCWCTYELVFYCFPIEETEVVLLQRLLPYHLLGPLDKWSDLVKKSECYEFKRAMVQI